MEEGRCLWRCTASHPSNREPPSQTKVVTAAAPSLNVKQRLHHRISLDVALRALYASFAHKPATSESVYKARLRHELQNPSSVRQHPLRQPLLHDHHPLTTPRRLYRRSLKLSLDWAVHRYLWRGQALYLRGLFEANRNVQEPRQLRLLITETENLLEKWKHPDPYRAPTAPGGTSLL